MKNTVLAKVLVLLLAVVIPLGIISSVSIRNINNELEKEIISSVDADLLRFSKELDGLAKNVYTSNMAISTQSNILMLVIGRDTLSVYQESQTINTISEQLSNICTTNASLDSANIYYHDTKRVYHSGSAVQGSFTDFNEAQYEFLSQKALHPEKVQRYVNPLTDTEVMSIFIAPFKQKNPPFIIEFIISEKYIKGFVETKKLFAEDLYYVEMCGKIVATDINEEHLAIVKDHALLQNQNSSQKLAIGDRNYYFMKYPLPYCDGIYVKLVSTTELLKTLRLSSTYLTIFFIVLVISCSFFFIGIYRLVHKPLIKLTKAFETLEKGDFESTITETKANDFSYLYHAFNNMTVKLRELIEHDYNQKIYVQKAELKQLQSQINPHFLYNSFFLLQSMLKTGMIEESKQVTEFLGLYFRYITKNSMDYVSLEEEYNHAKIYAQLQSLRFDKRITIHIEDIPEEYKLVQCPKLILQPILENAFNYGLSNKMSNGIISLKFKKINELVCIVIEDNGDELSDEILLKLQADLASAAASSDSHEMSGMLNIHRRLAIYSKSHGRIGVSRSQMGGLRVDVMLDTTV